MRAFTVEYRGFGRGQQCIQCRRTLKPGDCGFAQDYKGPVSSWDNGNRTMFWHRACIEKLLEDAPLDSGAYMKEFRELEKKAQEGTLL